MGQAKLPVPQQMGVAIDGLVGGGDFLAGENVFQHQVTVQVEQEPFFVGHPVTSLFLMLELNTRVAHKKAAMSFDSNPTRKRGTPAWAGAEAEPIPSLARRVSVGLVQFMGKSLKVAASS